jgi:hypothetical protein
MLSGLVCSSTANASSTSSDDAFCLQLGTWVSLGVGALVVVAAVVWLAVQAALRLCRYCGFHYGIVGDESAASASSSSLGSKWTALLLIYLAHAVQVRPTTANVGRLPVLGQQHLSVRSCVAMARSVTVLFDRAAPPTRPHDAVFSLSVSVSVSVSVSASVSVSLSVSLSLPLPLPLPLPRPRPRPHPRPRPP